MLSIRSEDEIERADGGSTISSGAVASVCGGKAGGDLKPQKAKAGQSKTMEMVEVVEVAEVDCCRQAGQSVFSSYSSLFSSWNFSMPRKSG